MYAVISDVHANLEALGAVLKDIEKRNVKGILFLGDAVGYGPDPNECVRLLKENCSVLLAGNHDWAVLGLTNVEYFNPVAKAAIRWTDENLAEKNRKIISGFSLVKLLKKESIFLVHSTPREPEEWHYLITLSDAEVNFRSFEQKVCLLGHSHSPFIVEKRSSGQMTVHKEKARLNKNSRYIINVGSVGQPRDGDPRACYALLNSEKIELIRVEYSIGETQRKMREAGLPEPLIQRLYYGM
jgi:predicted phosphodiesterase